MTYVCGKHCFLYLLNITSSNMCFFPQAQYEKALTKYIIKHAMYLFDPQPTDIIQCNGS